jgi:hypothetical protein
MFMVIASNTYRTPHLDVEARTVFAITETKQTADEIAATFSAAVKEYGGRIHVEPATIADAVVWQSYGLSIVKD